MDQVIQGKPGGFPHLTNEMSLEGGKHQPGVLGGMASVIEIGPASPFVDGMSCDPVLLTRRLDTQGCVLVELFSLSGCQSRIRVYAMCPRGEIWCMLNMSKADLPPSFYRDREEKLSLILRIRSCKDMESPEYLLG